MSDIKKVKLIEKLQALKLYHQSALLMQKQALLNKELKKEANLLNYHNEYSAQSLILRASGKVASRELMNNEAFINSIDDLLTTQKKSILRAQNVANDSKSKWLEAYSKRKATNLYLQKLIVAEKIAAYKKENKASDIEIADKVSLYYSTK